MKIIDNVSAVESAVTSSRAASAPSKKIVVHGPSDKPEQPPVGMIHFDRNTGYRERWDGTDWVPLKRTTTP